MTTEVEVYRSLKIFIRCKGEGRYVGTPMHFIRLAGCSVGHNPTLGREPAPLETLPILKTGNVAWMCSTYDGRAFWCDTDFHLDHWSSFTDLLDSTWENHICLTGGEPLMHEDKLHTFIEEASDRGVRVHIETSGTIEVVFDPQYAVWISVSPKLHALSEMIEIADEIKLLVDDAFDLEKVPAIIRNHALVYVQPINDELMVSKHNFDLCMDILRAMPNWRLSVQQHKLLGLR